MERAVAILPTDDLAEAKKFYVEGLGFHVTWEHTEDGHSGLIGIARGGIELTLDSPMDGHGRKAAVGIHVDDADGLYGEWVRNFPEIREPKNEDWGARTFGLQDPSDNTIFVMGPIPKK